MPVFGASSGGSHKTDPRYWFSEVANAIKAGNMTAAQRAFAELTQVLAPITSNHPDGILAQTLAPIGGALQAANMGEARRALDALQQQARARFPNGRPAPAAPPAPAPPAPGRTLDVRT